MYYITSTTDDSYWHKTSAKTLAGAKRAATAMYHQSLNGRIQVGYADGGYDAGANPIRVMAIKYGYDNRWTDQQ